MILTTLLLTLMFCTVAHFNELAGRITVGAAGGVQSVTGDNGMTTSGTTDVTVGGTDATTLLLKVLRN